MYQKAQLHGTRNIRVSILLEPVLQRVVTESGLGLGYCGSVRCGDVVLWTATVPRDCSVRVKWNGAQVNVFGSSGSQLATPSSDIDLTLHIPTEASSAPPRAKVGWLLIVLIFGVRVSTGAGCEVFVMELVG